MKKIYIKPGVEAFNVLNTTILEGSLNNELGDGTQLSKGIDALDIPGLEGLDGIAGGSNIFDIMDKNGILNVGSVE